MAVTADREFSLDPDLEICDLDVIKELTQASRRVSVPDAKRRVCGVFGIEGSAPKGGARRR
jgi:hypothetical protein